MKKLLIGILLTTLLITGCSKEDAEPSDQQNIETQTETTDDKPNTDKPKTEESTNAKETNEEKYTFSIGRYEIETPIEVKDFLGRGTAGFWLLTREPGSDLAIIYEGYDYELGDKIGGVKTLEDYVDLVTTSAFKGMKTFTTDMRYRKNEHTFTSKEREMINGREWLKVKGKASSKKEHIPDRDFIFYLTLGEPGKYTIQDNYPVYFMVADTHNDLAALEAYGDKMAESLKVKE